MSRPLPPLIQRLVLNVAELERSLAFYEQALGFERANGSARGALLRLGDQHIELVQQPDGCAYPGERSANDPWFQHFAIAVSNMDAAHAQLSRYGHEQISIGGPQQLPPSTGSVIAYKFRDPDGHPLELSYIPESQWTRATSLGDRLFLGIDHTGIAVADLPASVSFYSGLGFQLDGQCFNTGAQQDRLDGLEGVQLDISVMKAGEGPHIELLHYRRPRPTSAALRFGQEDIASTRIVLDDRTPEAGNGNPVSLRDPDGHWLEACRATA